MVCYPVLAPADLAAIEAFRHRHEPRRAKAILPHVTLVFGAGAIPEDELVGRLFDEASTTAPFPLTLDSPEPYRDPLRGERKVFLKVKGGREQVKRLYRALNRDAPLAPYAFDPHMTIASPESEGALATAVSEAASLPVPISAMATALQLLRFDGDRIVPLGEFAFGPQPGP
ncbi:MAG TPA: 2'-5' RNA ligase family protein [Devosiaceae bacterium]|nr:2'-5' RNA ligase family protein [Devosiaceae bacterium]